MLSSGVGFGEIALLYNDRRTATVRATEDDTKCWCIEGSVYKMVVIKQRFQRRNIKLSFLEKIEMFSHLDKYEKLKLVDGLNSKTLNQGEFVFCEGDEGENFYIIEEGEVECIKYLQNNECESDNGNEEFFHVRDLKVGDHFGEIALIKDVVRSLSVRIKSETAKLLYLNRDDFQRILGNINKYLKKDYDREFDNKFSTGTSFARERIAFLNN